MEDIEELAKEFERGCVEKIHGKLEKNPKKGIIISCETDYYKVFLNDKGEVHIVPKECKMKFQTFRIKPERISNEIITGGMGLIGGNTQVSLENDKIIVITPEMVQVLTSKEKLKDVV